MQYLAGLSEADSLNTQNDSLNIGLDSIKEEDVALYREMKKSRQDTTLYKSLSDADKAQLNKKKKSYNNKFYYAKDNKKMILIPGQAFKMGSDNGSDIEKPEYSVKVKDFYLDETEVTNAQFKKFLEESKYNPKGSLSHFRDRRFNKDDMPVVDVVYYDAIAYCEWAGKRLPSEREWECAAKDSQNYEYPTGTDMTDKDARFGLNITIGSPVSVKSYRPNKFGIYDLAGNVSEWVHGVISQYPGNITMSRSYGKDRIPRGGSWMSPKEDCKTYRRAILDISKSTGNIGFRCAIGKDEVIELINK
ncbi:MAG: formylglycine-generating enzyme family protein [Candidatus Delongbacteria bacterium]|nr:formylglycine-generating enzyme family protein [Candidatus Delongbacteria bacterium]